MRFNLLLITMLLIPYVAKGQQEPVVFYSQGKMYVGEGVVGGTASASNTSLYVAGSMQYVSDGPVSDPAKKVEVVQAGRTTLTGDIINALDPAHGENHLYTGGGEIEFSNPFTAGKYGTYLFTNSTVGNAQNTKTWDVGNTQRIISTYDFTNSSDLDKIKEQKRLNYLDINKIVVSGVRTNAALGKGSYLAIDPSAAIQVGTLDVASGAFFEIGTASTAAEANRKYLHTGYVKFKNALTTPAYTSNDVFRANYVHRVHLFNSGGSNVNTGPEGGYYLTGFTPLFKGLMADYMFFNTLTKPGNGSVTSWEGTITDPTTMMKSGTGYFMAMTDFDGDYQNIADNHFGGVLSESNNRTKNEYVFNRTQLVKNGSLQQKFNKKTSLDATFNVSEEIFNSSDVTVKLRSGFNFLGNPFTAPLDLSEIVNATPSSAFGVNISTGTSSNIRGIRNKYWVINKATVKKGTTTGWYEYTLSFYDAQVEGGTAAGLHGNKQNEFYVAPMQMFVVQAGKLCNDASGNADCAFTIPYSKTILNASSVAPRSLRAGDERIDEFVLEAVDLDSDVQDRLSIVMREKASLMDTDPTDTHKAVKNKEDDTERWYPTMDGIIYTRSSNDRPMLTNTVPTNTKQLAMYITPPSDKARNMMIRPYRMETMSTVSRVWLEDKFENKIIELTPETEYYFSSPVLTQQEASKNRFVLHFGSVENNDNDLVVTEDPISCYYNTSTLYIAGLNDKDLNSNVQIYDLQGRMVGRTVVNTVQRMEYPKPLPQGTYIVKITGKRNYTTKFVNLHN